MHFFTLFIASVINTTLLINAAPIQGRFGGATITTLEDAWKHVPPAARIRISRPLGYSVDNLNRRIYQIQSINDLPENQINYLWKEVEPYQPENVRRRQKVKQRWEHLPSAVQLAISKNCLKMEPVPAMNWENMPPEAVIKLDEGIEQGTVAQQWKDLPESRKKQITERIEMAKSLKLALVFDWYHLTPATLVFLKNELSLPARAPSSSSLNALPLSRVRQNWEALSPDAKLKVARKVWPKISRVPDLDPYWKTIASPVLLKLTEEINKTMESEKEKNTGGLLSTSI
ncbi:hypothetical protein C8J56DRAFT_1166698 [Mycena floridula]|nr:hypothetical protein C8J56DRAFT_1166698 [Mycena floridula]